MHAQFGYKLKVREMDQGDAYLFISALLVVICNYDVDSLRLWKLILFLLCCTLVLLLLFNFHRVLKLCSRTHSLLLNLRLIFRP